MRDGKREIRKIKEYELSRRVEGTYFCPANAQLQTLLRLFKPSSDFGLTILHQKVTEIQD